MRRFRFKSPVPLVVTLGIALGLAGSYGLLLLPWLPSRDSSQATRTDHVIIGITYVSGALFGLVVVMIAYSLLRWRSRDDEQEADGAPIHGHTVLEIFWTFIPVCIVTAFAIWAGVVLSRNEAHAKGERMVTVEGYQYAWNFIYSTDGGFTSPNALYLPVGQPVILRTVSKDVVHEFYVPEWRIGADAVPGHYNPTYATPSRTGTFQVLCAELCGPGHASMSTVAKVYVVSPAAFGRWLASQRKQAASAGPGKQLFVSNGCSGCHTYAPAGSHGTIGPDLDHLAADAKKAGQPLDQYVRQSIVAPNAYITPGFPPNVMPTTFGRTLSATDLKALVDFLTRGGSK